MSQMVQALFPAPDYRRTTLSLLHWWESRRLFYNGIVGGTGLLTAGVVELFALLPPSQPRMGVPLAGVLVWGIAANAFYSLGWAVEASMERVWKREAPLIGPVLFRQGVAFSVGLTLLPMALAGVGWVARVIEALF